MKVKIETRLVSNFYRSRNHRGIVESRGNGHSVSVVVVVVCEVAILVVVDDVVYGRRYGSSVACSEVAVLIKHIHRRLLRTYVPRLFQFSLSLREKERERERERERVLHEAFQHLRYCALRSTTLFRGPAHVSTLLQHRVPQLPSSQIHLLLRYHCSFPSRIFPSSHFRRFSVRSPLSVTLSFRGLILPYR